jgi:hypothetical protein
MQAINGCLTGASIIESDIPVVGNLIVYAGIPFSSLPLWRKWLGEFGVVAKGKAS